MELNDYRPIAEALLFACGEPISTGNLAETMGLRPRMTEELLQKMRQEYEGRSSGLRLLQLEDRWQLVTKTEYSAQVRTILDKRKNVPLSPAAMEVLAIIAYNQPVTRGFVEQVRGVDSSTIVAKLAERGLIEESGRLDLPGRPIAFKTTDTFLRVFGIESLSQLPRLHEDSIPEEPFEQTRMEQNEEG